MCGRLAGTHVLEDTATYLLGPVMGFVLLLRGTLCLHAERCRGRRRDPGLAGQPEAGKSTTAAALARRGYTVVSDDAVTLDHRDGRFLVHPAYPVIRLWSDSVETLYGSGDALPLLTPTWDKRYLDLTADGYRFQREPLPLAAGPYVLAERELDEAAPRVESASGRDALVALMANTYVTRLMDRAMRARTFDLLGRVVTRVPVRRVSLTPTPPAWGVCAT